jgi:hypothetical protein
MSTSKRRAVPSAATTALTSPIDSLDLVTEQDVGRDAEL